MGYFCESRRDEFDTKVIDGFRYKGELVSAQIIARADHDLSASVATIWRRRENGDIDFVTYKEFKTRLACARWQSKSLDGNPKVFGPLDLAEREREVARRNSIRSGGAECYVMGYLMMAHGISASLAESNMPGYDVLAHGASGGRNCRIQVKYREKASSVSLSNFDFDFLVLIREGRLEWADGWNADKDKKESREVQHWEVFVVPQKEAVMAAEFSDSGTRVNANFSNYFMNWRLIVDWLASKPAAAAAA